MLSFFFKKKGFHVSVSSSAEEAKESVRADIPDLVMLDIHLEGIKSGLHVHRFLRENYPSVRIFIASGTMEDEADMEVFKPDLFLKKPFSLKLLSEKIDSFFGNEL